MRLASWCEVEVRSRLIDPAGRVYRQRYVRGVPETELQVGEPTEVTGTTIRFKPDDVIFETVDYNQETVVHRLRELAFLNSGLRIALRDQLWPDPDRRP